MSINTLPLLYAPEHRPFVRALCDPAKEPPRRVFLNYRRKPFPGCSKVEVDREWPGHMGAEEGIDYIVTLPTGTVRRFAIPPGAETLVGDKALYFTITPEPIEPEAPFHGLEASRREIMCMAGACAATVTLFIWVALRG
jgi:hypothetical protein